jgi:dihydroorotate dehydrogenase (fumarate)
MDLSTTYLGLSLPHPIMPGASPLVDNLDTVRQLEDAGAAAIVMHSLFEEQITREELGLVHDVFVHEHSFAEALSYFPKPEDYALHPDRYLEQVHRIKAAVGVPVIGSLNGTTAEGWLHYAREIQDAGADALELNFYHVATDPREDGADVERRLLDIVRGLRHDVTIPIAVKLSPYFSSLSHLAHELDAAGASGLVLFNRFYQPDYDLEALEVVPNLILSNSHELLLRLHWIAVIYGTVKADLALTGGVHSATDVVKAMMAGARIAMMTSALLKRGIGFLDTISTELLIWMGEHEYDSIRQMQGSMSRNAVPQPGAFERANYMKVLSSYAMR